MNVGIDLVLGSGPRLQDLSGPPSHIGAIAAKPEGRHVTFWRTGFDDFEIGSRGAATKAAEMALVFTNDRSFDELKDAWICNFEP